MKYVDNQIRQSTCYFRYRQFSVTTVREILFRACLARGEGASNQSHRHELLYSKLDRLIFLFFFQKRKRRWISAAGFVAPVRGRWIDQEIALIFESKINALVFEEERAVHAACSKSKGKVPPDAVRRTGDVLMMSLH